MDHQPTTTYVPTIGDNFPNLTVHTTFGKKQIPQDYEGKWFVFFSHPGDFTPVCTTEFVSYALHQNEFADLNTELIGLSIDTVFAHMKWIEWINETLEVPITFPIIADELGVVASQLGMLAKGVGTRTVRSVYIVDPRGKIRLKIIYPPEVGRNTHEILRVLKALQVADKQKVSTPANWPQNEIIHDKVILAPPSTVIQAQKRIEQAKKEDLNCYDWWFCYRDFQ
ncbi:peroxiredoxin [Alkalihalobacterium alkalinitrilicum]|uniref:peroxiredoxin n=1 Tax=Alkalihalobacterium alkalinitrilicum TaxID=427920 RepID=UPI00114F4BD0|nr:peroxiredoxin [Alkalihalobacterium alkalinitrilicum]